MAVFNFPDSPSINDVYTDNGVSWKWTGTVWKKLTELGSKGTKGVKGDKGQKGVKGEKGDKGDKGQKGIDGTNAGKAIDQLGANIRPNSVLGRSTGMILNSNLELLFSGVTLRTFPFSINFSPRNEAESEMVISIIKALKSSMAAKKKTSEPGQGGIFLKAPDVFQLRYLHKVKSIHS